jgi:integrase
MALLVECVSCKRRNSAKAKSCKCGQTLSKLSGKVYWISYYVGGKLKRERIGPNKQAAEQRLRQVLSDRTENRYIRKCPDGETTFGELARWYLTLAEVQSKRSLKRDRVIIKQLVINFGDILLRDVTPAQVEAYRRKRLATIKPASANREISCLRSIFNRAIKNDKAERNPCARLKMLKENNERDRVLTPDEFARLLAACPDHIKPIVNVGYHTGMRKGEILGLTWGQVDLKEGFIHLKPENCKTNEGRDIPLCPELLAMFRGMARGLPAAKVFTRNGQPVKCIREAFAAACRRAGIENFVFHDLRHCFCTNAFKAGLPIPIIQKITGHKTMAMFKRYTAIQAEDLKNAIAKMGG